MRDFGSLPFVCRPLDHPTNGDFPDFLPFALDQEEESGLIIQLPNPEVENVLQRVYSNCSMVSGMMDKQGIGEKYANDFLSYIKRRLNRGRFDGLSVLDIGCGTGYLLSLLKELGAKVVGLEPGSHGQDGARKYDIPIIRDFFPSLQMKNKFDIILAFCVLEHVQSYESFLQNIQKQLKDNGVIFLAVPDCQPYLDTGDISFLFHEHWNYFTAYTLQSILQRVTGLTIEIEKATFGGSLYATACNVPESNVYKEARETALRKYSFLRFLKQADHANHLFQSKLEDIYVKGQTIGFYVPGRAMNILARVELGKYLPHLRFFDDNKALQGTYYPGFDVIIESRQNLLNNPPDELVIMSHTFGDKIQEELRRKGLKSIVTTWHDIFVVEKEMCDK
jgi:SAM-dependent methyltransferase